MPETNVTLKDCGPILVSGDFTLCDGEGNPIDTAGKATVALCRCAKSENSPFCDGKHKDCGFSVKDRA